jgi:hypothetical protein
LQRRFAASAVRLCSCASLFSGHSLGRLNSCWPAAGNDSRIKGNSTTIEGVYAIIRPQHRRAPLRDCDSISRGSIIGQRTAPLTYFPITSPRTARPHAKWYWCRSRPSGYSSQLYLEALPIFMQGLVSLPNHERLIRELRLLERHAQRGCRDRVDHGRTGSDDYSNAVCGLLYNLSNLKYRYDSTLSWVS